MTAQAVPSIAAPNSASSAQSAAQTSSQDIGATDMPGISMSRSAGAAPANGPAGSDVKITFAPPSSTASPMDQLGAGILDRLRAFEKTRAASQNSLNGVTGGPASVVESAKAELLGGPARSSMIAGGNSVAQTGDPLEQATTAMMRSFDYAIETTLVVKTGSQVSSSANSLLRGQ